MKVNLKICCRCDKPKRIWKVQGKLKYCRTCWSILHPTSITVKPKPLAKSSKKRTSENREYSKSRIEFLKKLPFCEAHLSGCTLHSTDVHHKKGRIGKLLLDQRWWLSTCRNCHNWIELHPEEAKELGLSLSRLN